MPESEHPIYPAGRKKLCALVETPNRKLNHNRPVRLEGFESEEPWADLSDRVELAELSTLVLCSLLEIGDSVRLNSHEPASDFIGCQSIIANQDGIHADRKPEDGTLAFQANAAVNDAQVRRTKFMQAADQGR